MSGKRGLPTDREVVDGLLRGDVRVFDALYLAYHDALWRFAFELLHSRDSAQDVVQDVLLSVWERRAQLTITTSLSAYLFSAIRRRSLMYIRQHRTAERIAATWAPDDVPALGEMVASPLAIAERQDFEALLTRALESLPSLRRQVVALRWGQHMEYTEIAEALEISVDAVRAHVSRACHALRTLLQALGVDPPV